MLAFWLNLAAVTASGEPGAVAVDSDWAANLGYLVAALLLIGAATQYARPLTAATGRMVATAGILLAIAATLWRYAVLFPIVFGVALCLGASIGAWLAIKAKTSTFSNRSILFTAMGGVATAIVGAGALLEERDPSAAFVIAVAVAGVLGSIAFSSGWVAHSKVENYGPFARPVSTAALNIMHFAAPLVVLILAIWLVQSSRNQDVASYALVYLWLTLAAALFGALSVLPTSGSSLQAAIGMSNSAAGLGVAAIGFALDNPALIIVGAVIGAATASLSHRLRTESAIEPRA